MKTGFMLVLIAWIIAMLHCHALRQRIAYLEKQCENEYARGMVEAVTAMQTGILKVLTNSVNSVQTAFEKEVAP